MIKANDTRYGLDVKLYLIQRYLDLKLSDAVIYGQLHENEKQSGKVLEWPSEEKEVFVDDKESMIIGFRLLSKSVNNYLGQATLDMICSLSTDNREYSEVEMYKHLAKCGYINSISTVKSGISQIFTGLFNDDIKYRDIHPFHIFAFTIQVNYNYDICG